MDVLMTAQNGRPKVVRFGRWETSVHAGRLILTADGYATDVSPVVRVGRSWDVTGLSVRALQLAAAFARRLDSEGRFWEAPKNLAEVKRYMRDAVTNHLDSIGDVDSTALAEDACRHFDGYGPGADFPIPEVFFEASFQVASEHERQAGLFHDPNDHWKAAL